MGEPTNSQNYSTMKLKEKIKYIFKNITVEPLLICYVMPSLLAGIAVFNFNIEKACRVNKNYSEQVCDDLIHQRSNETAIELEVQTLVAYMSAWSRPLQTAIPAIAILFVGAWSDKTGKRKPCFLVPVVGEFISSFGLILCTYYFLQWPLETAGIIEALPPALTGGHATLYMATFTYIADITTTEERTYRIGLVNMITFIAIPIGTALSGTLLHAVGFYGVFAICLLIRLIAFVYGWIRIQNKKNNNESDQEKGCKKSCIEFFDWRLVASTLLVVVKKRKFNKRLQLMFVVLGYILVVGPVHGIGALGYLYARAKYQFSEVEYSIYGAYSFVVNAVGIFVTLSILSKRFQIHDSTLGVIACISLILGHILYAYAPSKEWFYVAPLIEFFGGTAIIAIRAMATKIVEPDEFAKINSVFGVTEAISASVYPPIFAVVYAETLSTYPEALFLLAAASVVLPLLNFLCLYKLHKIEDRETEKEEQEMIEKEGKDNPSFEVSRF